MLYLSGFEQKDLPQKNDKITTNKIILKFLYFLQFIYQNK